MAERPEVVARLRDAVEARRKKLKLSPGKFHEAVGFASTTVDNIRKGYRRAYAEDVKWAVCAALGWSDDSIDRLLGGKDPILVRQDATVRLSTIATTATMPRVTAREAKQPGDNTRQLLRLTKVVDQLEERVAALEARADPPEPSRVR